MLIGNKDEVIGYSLQIFLFVSLPLFIPHSLYLIYLLVTNLPMES